MDIYFEPKKKLTFSDLKVGDVFIDYESDEVCMKLDSTYIDTVNVSEKVNAVQLATGNCWEINDTDPVQKCEARLAIN